MAGGLDTFDWLKDRTKRTQAVVELGGVAELSGIKEADGGLEIGATTTLTEVATHPIVKQRFGLLAQAAGLVASPQIRHQGTLGGNVSQDARCWYYRSGWPCYRAGGNICYADTPTAINREHAILECRSLRRGEPIGHGAGAGGAGCQHGHSPPRQRASRARRATTSSGRRTTSRGLTVLQPGDLLTAIRIPATWAGAEFYFEKIRDRQVWDFPLVNIASALKVSGSTIQALSIAVGAVAATPVKLDAVEAAVAGKPRTRETAEMAGRLAVEGAQPLAHNGYKIPLMRNLVARAIRGAGAATT